MPDINGHEKTIEAFLLDPETSGESPGPDPDRAPIILQVVEYRSERRKAHTDANPMSASPSEPGRFRARQRRTRTGQNRRWGMAGHGDKKEFWVCD